MKIIKAYMEVMRSDDFAVFIGGVILTTLTICILGEAVVRVANHYYHFW